MRRWGKKIERCCGVDDELIIEIVIFGVKNWYLDLSGLGS